MLGPHSSQSVFSGEVFHQSVKGVNVDMILQDGGVGDDKIWRVARNSSTRIAENGNTRLDTAFCSMIEPTTSD